MAVVYEHLVLTRGPLAGRESDHANVNLLLMKTATTLVHYAYEQHFPELFDKRAGHSARDC